MHEKSAGFVIFRRKHSNIEYLVMKASEMSQDWGPPKGHVENEEDDLETAFREVREEAGYLPEDLIVYKDIRHSMTYKVYSNDKTVVFWLAEVKDPNKNPKLSHEHTNFRWLPKDDVITLVGYENFAKMVTQFHDQLNSL